MIQTLLALALGALFWFALDPQSHGRFSAGSLVAFITAAAQMGKPSVPSAAYRALFSADSPPRRISEQLDTPRSPTGHPPDAGPGGGIGA